jgi:hypothetical protein
VHLQHTSRQAPGTITLLTEQSPSVCSCMTSCIHVANNQVAIYPGRTTDAESASLVRCAFFDRNPHSRMPLSFMPLLRLKRCHACDQCPMSFLSSVHSPLTSEHCKFRPNAKGYRQPQRNSEPSDTQSMRRHLSQITNAEMGRRYCPFTTASFDVLLQALEVVLLDSLD